MACHSHHFWPDVTREAQLAYWDDSARLADEKWAFFFAEKVPALQRHIARLLSLPDPKQLAFAANTHEFVMRLFSCLPRGKKARVLTTDSEFHSFTRQSQRLAEAGDIELVKVPTQPFASFEQRFIEQAAKGGWDMVFFSQVFFNSAVAVNDLAAMVNAVPDPDCIIAIDGYHGFCALPTDLSRLAGRVFYLAGGYKYAQGGEGCCFMAVPPACQLAPRFTGWYAEFGALAQSRGQQTVYADNGMRFAGATFDFSALYRLLAVFDWWQRDGIEVAAVHAHIQMLQQAFLKQLAIIDSPQLNSQQLLANDLTHHGHFLTFALADAATTSRVADFLRTQGLLTDHRDNRLRFGFAPYHELADINLKVLSDI